MKLKSPHFSFKKGRLFVDGHNLANLSERFGSPLYVYSGATIADAYDAYEVAFAKFPHLVCFALKANSNLAIGRFLSKRGAGADIVSGGELSRALLAGFPPTKIIFSGVGKTAAELRLALRAGVRLINVESEEELKTLAAVAQSLRKVAPFSLRVNPDVRAGGHPHISTGTPQNKFGVYHKNIDGLYRWAKKNKFLSARGIQCHIGSQITSVVPYERALTVMLDLYRHLSAFGIKLDVLDLGGGLGVDYNGDGFKTPADLARVLLPRLGGTPVTLFLEPGRSLVAQAGLLVTKVLYRKKAGPKTFVVVDAAMNDLARPALYDAYHEIVPVQNRSGRTVAVDIVGPICESGDYLAKNRALVLPRPGDFLAVQTAGAYGFSMSSQYNTRPRVAEVLLDGARVSLIRQRETVADLIRGEKIPPYLK